MQYDNFKKLIENLRQHYMTVGDLVALGVDLNVSTDPLSACVDILMEETLGEAASDKIWDAIFGVEEWGDIDDEFIAELWQNIQDQNYIDTTMPDWPAY